ncbi:MAG: hypothetical protein CL862_03020 [Cyanobium sp. NAT70]|nr:hypothetical protein [Cyanobium sp. NAT70]
MRPFFSPTQARTDAGVFHWTILSSAENKRIDVGKPDAHDWGNTWSWGLKAIQNPIRERQGGLIVPIDLPT